MLLAENHSSTYNILLYSSIAKVRPSICVSCYNYMISVTRQFRPPYTDKVQTDLSLLFVLCPSSVQVCVSLNIALDDIDSFIARHLARRDIDLQFVGYLSYIFCMSTIHLLEYFNAFFFNL